ncbi:glycosyltransferase family 4 protein [Alcanivoracaceae bacterium MT1]
MKLILSVEPIRFPLTGIGRYAYELAKGMLAVNTFDEFRLFSGVRFISDLPEPVDQSPASHDFRRLAQKSRLVTSLYGVLMPLIRKRALSGFDAFIYHSTNFFLPPFPGRKVATFHDLSPFTWSQCYDPAKIGYLQRGLSNTLHTADALITDSEYTRRELAEFASWPLERIHAVPLAAGPEFQPRNEADIGLILEHYGLSYRGYTLFVGTIEPRKNIIALLDAYGRIPREVRERYPLVLSGHQGWKSEQIHDRIRQAESEGWVRYLGFLPAAHLPGLYSGARLFAFPSLYEGFGLPVLEAMQSGVPVVCSNSSSLPEVAGGAALTVESADVVGLSENMRRVLLDEELAEGLTEKGLQRAGEFRWQSTVARTYDVYASM